LPLAFFNDGAIPLLITDLRIDISEAGCFPWQTTRSKLRPDLTTPRLRDAVLS
jgi:hypothetical protein